MILSVHNLPRLEPPSGVVHILEEQADFRQQAAAWGASLGHQTIAHESIDAILAANLTTRPACLVLDLSFDSVSGLDLQSRFKREKNSLPFVFIASRANVRSAVTAMEQGAVTVLERPCGKEQFAEAVAEAITRDALVHRLSRRMEELRCRFNNLSVREKLVMQLVVDGRLNKAIARELKMTERTVERVRAIVLDKVGADSAVQMASLLTEHRLLCELLCEDCPTRPQPGGEFVMAS